MCVGGGVRGWHRSSKPMANLELLMLLYTNAVVLMVLMVLLLVVLLQLKPADITYTNRHNTHLWPSLHHCKAPIHPHTLNVLCKCVCVRERGEEHRGGTCQVVDNNRKGGVVTGQRGDTSLP